MDSKGGTEWSHDEVAVFEGNGESASKARHTAGEHRNQGPQRPPSPSQETNHVLLGQFQASQRVLQKQLDT